MRTLFAKILLAQVISVVLALLVVLVITRVSLSEGFVDFLERQESAVLDITAPALAELYETRGGWEFLRGQPENWHNILRHARDMLPEAPERGRGQPRRGRPQRAPGLDDPPGPPDGHPLRWLRSLDHLRLRDRLFLLDAERGYLAGARVEDHASLSLRDIKVGDDTVGWIGFAPMGKELPPEAQRFLMGQVKVLSASLLVALGLAALLGFLLARHLSQPVRKLAETVTDLSNGQFDRRANISGRDEISRLAVAINRLAETLEKNRSARHRWMADIAHELRTPVAILKGEIEALADGIRRPDKRLLSSLGEEIDQLAVLVDDLQTLALADAGALNLRRENVDLGTLVQQVAESFRERLAERGIRLEFDLRPTTMINADPQRLRQLLHNLFENSARYVEPDGLVRVALTAAPESVQIIVEDSGPGVTTEELVQLFERFFRVERGRSRVGGGSGLGLSICRNIAEAHGGSILARHSEHGGLAIRIELPR